MDKRFQIVTDSSCDLPQAMADELDLAVLPLHVHIGEETYANYLDGREIGFHDFFNRIASGEKATTSAVNVEEFKVVLAVLQSPTDTVLDEVFLKIHQTSEVEECYLRLNHPELCQVARSV